MHAFKLDLGLRCAVMETHIGQTLRQLRQRAQWSRAELARRSKLNASTVGAIELGRLNPYAGQILKLAKALGVSVAQLTGKDAEVDS